MYVFGIKSQSQSEHVQSLCQRHETFLVDFARVPRLELDESSDELSEPSIWNANRCGFENTRIVVQGTFNRDRVLRMS